MIIRRLADIKEESSYTFRTLSGEFYMGTAGAEQGDEIVLCPKGDESILWQVKKVGKAFVLVNRATGMALDVMMEGTEDGTLLHQWEDLAAESQMWNIKFDRKGGCQMISKKAERCVDIAGMAVAEGACLQLWENVKGENQQWVMEDPTLPEPEKKPAAKKPAAKKTEEKTTKVAEKAPAKKKETAPKAAKTTKKK